MAFRRISHTQKDLRYSGTDDLTLKGCVVVCRNGYSVFGARRFEVCKVFADAAPQID